MSEGFEQLTPMVGVAKIQASLQCCASAQVAIVLAHRQDHVPYIELYDLKNGSFKHQCHADSENTVIVVYIRPCVICS